MSRSRSSKRQATKGESGAGGAGGAGGTDPAPPAAAPAAAAKKKKKTKREVWAAFAERAQWLVWHSQLWCKLKQHSWPAPWPRRVEAAAPGGGAPLLQQRDIAQDPATWCPRFCASVDGLLCTSGYDISQLPQAQPAGSRRDSPRLTVLLLLLLVLLLL
eukprot:CAMPEP_0206614636 /NCGR_PEP_ID=MMETSP0325_2-20121206/57541_1 /ASSEMBLY_ACC=CAM_ASM_000347 /TAXON_ID=2866 /ORGANISM="Crypthecodinium cohnii, Strain Seligo" /LENGTH=158 /DNA_ID=CAMNT_0054135233 /DNA_START=1390 /DNA_END=1863 /DNA_ORIENTATION=-